jgi:hypothetical protein
VFEHKTASLSATNVVVATVPDVVVEVAEADRDEDAVRAVGDNGSVMAGGDIGEARRWRRICHFPSPRTSSWLSHDLWDQEL